MLNRYTQEQTYQGKIHTNHLDNVKIVWLVITLTGFSIYRYLSIDMYQYKIRVYCLPGKQKIFASVVKLLAR